MRTFFAAFLLGFAVVSAARFVQLQSGPEPASADAPEGSNAPTGEEKAREAPDPEALAALVRAAGQLARSAPSPPGRAPDLHRADDLIGHFYGDPIPWDSEASQRSAETRFTSAGEELRAAGAGELVKLECSSYPCLGMVETAADKPLSEALGAVREHLDGLEPWSFTNVEVDGGEVRRIVVQQVIEDVSRWEPHLQMRKADLMIDATAPDSHLPTEEEARSPIVWPETRR